MRSRWSAIWSNAAAALLLILGTTGAEAHWPWIEFQSENGTPTTRLVLGLFPEVRLKGRVVEKMTQAQLWLSDQGAEPKLVSMSAGPDYVSTTTTTVPFSAFAFLDYGVYKGEGPPARLLFKAKATSGTDPKFIYKRASKASMEVVPTSTGLPLASGRKHHFRVLLDGKGVGGAEVTCDEAQHGLELRASGEKGETPVQATVAKSDNTGSFVLNIFTRQLHHSRVRSPRRGGRDEWREVRKDGLFVDLPFSSEMTAAFEAERQLYIPAQGILGFGALQIGSRASQNCQCRMQE